MESNWTHVPHGYKDEKKLTQSLASTANKVLNWENAFVESITKEQQHNLDHLKMENVILKNKITKQSYLLQDFKDLVDMFATGNVDLLFYKRVIKDYFNSLEPSNKG
jgi:hypothetical protein